MFMFHILLIDMFFYSSVPAEAVTIAIVCIIPQFMLPYE